MENLLLNFIWSSFTDLFIIILFNLIFLKKTFSIKHFEMKSAYIIIIINNIILSIRYTKWKKIDYCNKQTNKQLLAVNIFNTQMYSLITYCAFFLCRSLNTACCCYFFFYYLLHLWNILLE